jgi:hypothetical protein
MEANFAGAAAVVHVIHGPLDIGMAHPGLDMDDGYLVDRGRPEGMPELATSTAIRASRRPADRFASPSSCSITRPLLGE